METKTEPKVDQALDIMLEYKPLGDNVVIQLPTKAEREAMNKTSSGIIKTAKQRESDPDLIYTVVAVGDLCKEVKVMDRVILRPIPIPYVILNGKEFGQVSEFHVMGKVLK